MTDCSNDSDPAQRSGASGDPAAPGRSLLRPKPQGLYDPAREHDACGIGFVAHLRGERTNDIVRDATSMLVRMDHRGGCGCEPNTGDGAGMLTGLPYELFERVARDELGLDLPERGSYAVGNVFLPQDDAERARCREVVEAMVERQGQRLLAWRTVPIDSASADIGPTAKSAQPIIEQLLVAASEDALGDAFERQLYLIRKQATTAIRSDDSMEQRELFYICSLSARTIVYKGMLTSSQLTAFYRDLQAADYASHLAMVHSRFSTNTFPSWDRAQPNRYMSHNGEINTLRGNVNWMHARQGVLESDLFGDQLERSFPVVEPDCSDSGSFDNVLEFLQMTGRSLHESVMTMVPEAWQNDAQMDPHKRDFYRYQSALMEPWDGPASIAFTDGRTVGAVLDRNGLRPSRYYVTDDDRVIMASEVGVVPVAPEQVLRKGRLKPGRMFLVDFEEGRIVEDSEIKQRAANAKPYSEWLEGVYRIEDLDAPSAAPGLDRETLLERMLAFGYTAETLRFMLRPLVEQLRDPVGSMGNDAALACMSDQPRLLYDYFKQLFAQVTNPPIDSIREEVVMSLACFVGPERDLLHPSEVNCHRLLLEHPVLSNDELARLRGATRADLRTITLDATWSSSEGVQGVERALERIALEAEAAVDEGVGLIVLSDRAASPTRVPIPTLLACGAVHHHLLRTKKRTRVGLLLETGEAREVHHHCLLIGYGADAINPYLALEALEAAFHDGRLPSIEEPGQILAAYRKGTAKGILKVMAKMGISTLQSYKGAQIFEAVGLADDVIERCFAGTASRLQGASLELLAEECLRRHERAFPEAAEPANSLPNPGDFHWRAAGEEHMWTPVAISSLRTAARTNTSEAYERFARLADGKATRSCALRGLLDLKADAGSISIDDVEPASEIVKRFCTGAMSFGSISKESHETLAIAMNRLGGKSNTGEGGEDPERFVTLENGDSKRSAIKQIASGRFGVTSWYLTNADELQIKMAQGAKPGEGGELPGHKVDDVIARTRHSTPGVGLISPPPHHDIYSIEDLKQLIHDLKNANPEARISVKLVSEIGVGTVAAGVAKGFADHILISGHDGGTGASPLTSIKHAGLPWELGIAETHQTLVLNDLRSRVTLQTDGQLKTGRDVVIAAALGAEEFGFSTAPLIAMGCIMMRKCHLNTCPVGIATQDPELRKKFAGKPEHVVNYLFMVAEHARRLMASIGVSSVRELVGRVDLLEPRHALEHWKADGLDLSKILEPARGPHPDVEVTKTREQDHGLELALDHQLIELAGPALTLGKPVEIELPIGNTNRTVGTMLSHEIMKAKGENGLPPETIHVSFDGSAGQSFGAFLARGVTLELEGDANDYVGKGLSGGDLVIYPPKSSVFRPEDQVIVGNVALYGATSGTALIRGRAAERFCVRNSGARAVIEGVGDHGCEYMTGGRAVVLGPVGRNFAAGMSGGIAWLWDPDNRVARNCNAESVTLEGVDADLEDELHELLELHATRTGSGVARAILDDWPRAVSQFVQVMPNDLRRVLAETTGGEAAA